MGIISDKCPECGATVRRAAKFCSKCGKPGPKSWFKCPSCNSWAGGESSFCWNCKTPLHPESRGTLAGGVWQRRPGVFAVRLSVGDLRDSLKSGLTVEAGTAAILLREGVIDSILEPGAHTLSSMAERLKNWGAVPPKSVILIDTGDVVLPLRIEGLRTAEELPVEFYGEVVLRFDGARASDFLANVLKDRSVLECATLSELMTGEIRYAVDNFCLQSAMADLIRDPTRRLKLENILQSTLTDLFTRSGLMMIRVPAAEFAGPEYEKLRERMGDVEIRRREVEYNQRLRELIRSDEMNRFKTEHDVEDYAKQLAHERGVSDTYRDQETGILKQLHRHEIEAKEAVHQLELATNRAELEIGVKIRWDDYDRDRRVKNAKTHAETREVERETEDKDVHKALEWRAEKRRLEREEIATRAKLFEGIKLEALIAAVDDPVKREHLLRLHARMQATGRTPQEILAMQAS